MSKYEVAKSILNNNLLGIKYSQKMLQTPDEISASRKGECLEQVELARSLFKKQNIECKSYFLEMNRGNDNPESWKYFVPHGFIVLEEDNKFYWLERPYCNGKFIGVHQYNSLKELLSDVVEKTLDFFQNEWKYPTKNIRIRQYEAPELPIAYTQHLLNCLSAKEIKIEEL